MKTTHKEQKMNATLAARMTVSAQIQAIAQRRVDSLTGISAAYDRRDELKANLERGVSAVALAELHILEEEIAGYEEDIEAQQASEIAAENAWLRAAEYDPRMEDPREW